MAKVYRAAVYGHKDTVGAVDSVKYGGMVDGVAETRVSAVHAAMDPIVCATHGDGRIPQLTLY